MLKSIKRSQHLNEEDIPQERRKNSDRRMSTDRVRFPFIDDDCKLVMKNRRSLPRRNSDTKLIKNPLKIANKLLKK